MNKEQKLPYDSYGFFLIPFTICYKKIYMYLCRQCDGILWRHLRHASGAFIAEIFGTGGKFWACKFLFGGGTWEGIKFLL